MNIKRNFLERTYESTMGRFFPKHDMYEKPSVNYGDSDGEQNLVPIVDLSKIQKEIEDDIPKPKNYKNAQAVTELFSDTRQDKKSYFKAVDEIKNYDLAEGIIKNIGLDVLTKDVDTRIDKKFFTIKIDEGIVGDKAEEHQKTAQCFVDELELKQLLKDYINDILWYGEQLFNVDRNEIEVEDIENQPSLTPLYSKNRFKYLVSSGVIQSSSEYLLFRFGSSDKKLVLKTKGDDKNNTITKFFVRPSKGIFSINVINKLKTLKLLESLIPVNEITSLSRKMQFYMRVPQGTSPGDAFKQSRKYELMIKNLLKFETPNNEQEVMKQLLDVKVIPIFGDQQELSEGNIQKPEKLDLSYINDMRESLVNSTNIPRHFIFPNDEASTSPSYLKLLQFIRTEVLGDGVRHLVYNFFKSKNIEIDYSAISIEVPKIQGIEELDTIEYVQMFSQSLSDITRLIQDGGDLLDRAPDSLDKKELVDFLNEKTSTFTGRELFKYVSEEN